MEQSKDFLLLIGKDREGKEFSYDYLHRRQIVYASFNAIECKLMIVVNEQNTNHGLQQYPKLNKHGEPSGGQYESVVSNTRTTSFTYADRESIVMVHNFLIGDNYTVETFPGFILHEEIKEEIKLASERKKKEEEDKKWMDDLEAENRYRTQSNLPALSLEEFKALRMPKQQEGMPTNTDHLSIVKDEPNTEEGELTEGGRLESTPGTEVQQELTVSSYEEGTGTDRGGDASQGKPGFSEEESSDKEGRNEEEK